MAFICFFFTCRSENYAGPVSLYGSVFVSERMTSERLYTCVFYSVYDARNSSGIQLKKNKFKIL